MICFLDGIAQGKHLNLARIPQFLRVVIDEKTRDVDALDQLDDQIREGEYAIVYELDPERTSVIYCSRGCGCRHEEHANYRQYATQPSQEILRDNERWAAWAAEEHRSRQAMIS